MRKIVIISGYYFTAKVSEEDYNNAIPIE